MRGRGPLPNYVYKDAINRMVIPSDVKKRIEHLVRYATSRGVLSYIAYRSALRYVIENECPEFLLKIDLSKVPIRGYAKCISIWRDAGLIKHTSRREAITRAINSPLFEAIFVGNGFDGEFLDKLRERVIELLDERGAPRGNLRTAILRLVSIAMGDLDGR